MCSCAILNRVVMQPRGPLEPADAAKRAGLARRADMVEYLPSLVDRLLSPLAMSDRRSERLELLQGTLDMLILKTLLFGPTHGHGIATYIRQTTGDSFVVDHGSLYPALHRLQRDGFIASKWETPAGRTRELKHYRLTAAGRRHLTREESRWNDLVRAIGRVMNPLPEG